MADKEFIPIAQAAALTGKSAKKLSKLCENYRDTKYIKLKNGEYAIRFDFLTKQFPMLEKPASGAEAEAQPQAKPDEWKDAKDEPDWQTHIIQVMAEQLKEKDRQLAAKDAQLSQMIERSREQNNIIFSLEQHSQILESRLGLPISAQEKSPATEPDRSKSTLIHYITLGLTVLLAGIILIIFYTVLTS